LVKSAADYYDPLYNLTFKELAARLDYELGRVADYTAELPEMVRGLDSAATREMIAMHDRGYGLIAYQLQRLVAELQRRAAQPRGQRVTIGQLLAVAAHRLRPAGSDRWRALCPWHDDTRPSLVVYADGHAHCFACGAHHSLAELAAAWKEGAA
jgi:hypothetical protein